VLLLIFIETLCYLVFELVELEFDKLEELFDLSTFVDDLQTEQGL